MINCENKIPSGNVTFLFTDIEGSTKLAQDFPDKLPSALEKHHSILTKAIESSNGFIFQIVGDAFCCSFRSSEDAVKAASEIQINLANENWDEAVIRVRIGIHSGNAEWNGKNYMGYITLARTSRIMSAAYGGQILISKDAHNLLSSQSLSLQGIAEASSLSSPQNEFSNEISFRDLGERRLKDVILPIRLYQIVGAGLREDFPPLNTLDSRPNNLPIQLTSFIGRETEMKDVKEALRISRLMTLTSAGGSGKTRLALQTAADVIDEYESGVWFVDLAAVNDPALLTVTVIFALGIKEESKKTSEETLTEFLKEKEILILLDNCEQLVHACAELTERLLSSCPKLKIIATSREALNCKGEKTYRIPPLTMPDPKSNDTPEQLIKYESVRLFIERALAVNPKFRVTNENAPALAEVCSRLDGIPLAIELAAARTKILSVEKIYERLDDRFSLLTGGRRTALPRQQTLRALIDWSYDLLAEDEKILWSRLSLFSGGWTLEAAEEICSDETISKNEILDLLSQLTEKSVTIYDESKERYRMLESIRQYGIEKLPDKNEIFLRHLNYFLELSEKAEPELRSENAKFWLDMIEAEHSNLTAAIDWSLNNGNTEKGGHIAAAIGEFWDTKGHYSMGIRLIENILQSSGELNNSVKSKMLSCTGTLKLAQGDYEQAKKYSEESLNIRKEICDNYGIAVSLNNLGCISFHQGDYERAKKYFGEGLDINKEIGDKKVIAATLVNLGNISYYQGDYEQAEKYYKECLAISKEVGDKKVISLSYNSLGSIAYVLGDPDQARKYYQESLTLGKEIGNRKMIAISVNNLGYIANYQGDYEQARTYYYESVAISKEIGDKRGIATSMDGLGNTSYSLGDYEQAEKYYKECLSIYRASGDKKGMADSMNNLGGVLYTQENFEQAKTYFEESLDIKKELGDRKGMADSMNNLGRLARHREEYEQADKYHKECLAIRKEIGDKKGAAEAISNLGITEFNRGEYEQAKKYHKESLAICSEIGDKNGIAYSLNNLGTVSAIQGDYALTVKLLSASEKILESIVSVVDKEYRSRKDDSIAKTVKHLSDDEFSKYWELGKNLTLEEVYRLAMKS